MLLGNYLSAFIYSAGATFKFLEQEGLIEAVFQELFVSDSKMFHSYQRKLYLIGFGQCLFSDYIPEWVNQNIVKIISKMILMLGRLNLSEKYKEKKLQESGKAQIDLSNDPFENPHSDGEDEKIEDELKEINEYYAKEASNQGFDSVQGYNEGPFNIQHEEQDMGKEEEDKNTEATKEKDDALNDSLRGSDSDLYDEEEEAFQNDKMEVEMVYDMLVSKVKDIDENMYFKSVMVKLYNNNQDEMSNLIKQLSDKQRTFMERLLQTQMVKIEADGQTKNVHRRILKARRRGK